MQKYKEFRRKQKQVRKFEPAKYFPGPLMEGKSQLKFFSDLSVFCRSFLPREKFTQFLREKFLRKTLFTFS